MKAITAVGATPQRMEILYSILREAGAEGEERTHLAALLGPNSLAKNTEDPGEDNALSDCLALGQDMGLVKVEGDRVALVDPTGPSSFLQLAGQQMVDRVTSASPVDGWVAGAITWMLRQDPREPLPWSGSGAVSRLQAQLGAPLPYGMTNDSRLQNAVYWARALGFVTRLKLREEVVLPDPTQALKQRLDHVLPRGQQVTMPAFLTALSRACPVFEGGSVHREVATRAGIDAPANVVSSSLALAFLRLKQHRELEFHYFDDADVVEIEGVFDDGRVTHVSRPQAAA
ncbi:MAG: protein DpdG [Caulobacteraceae bacterium]